MLRCSLPVCLVLAVVCLGVNAQSSSPFGAQTGPADSKAARLFGKANKELAAGKFDDAFSDFLKADQQDHGHCASCEFQAYLAAKRMENFYAAREQANLLLSHAASPEEKAEAHALLGDACLGEGGYRIFEKPFQDADHEYQAALQIDPAKRDCLFNDGVALAHLSQYPKAQERFQQVLK